MKAHLVTMARRETSGIRIQGIQMAAAAVVVAL
jgi:hypothetical protein